MEVITQPRFSCRTSLEHVTIDGVRRPTYVWASTDLPFVVVDGLTLDEVEAEFKDRMTAELEIIEEYLREGAIDDVRFRLNGGMGKWGRWFKRLWFRPNHVVSFTRTHDSGDAKVHGTRTHALKLDGYTKMIYCGCPRIELYIPEFDIHTNGSTLKEAEVHAQKAIYAHIDRCLSVTLKGYVNQLHQLFRRGITSYRRSGHVRIEILL